MVGGRDLIVPICLNAFDWVVRIIIELIKHHLIHLVVHWHRLLAWEKTLGSSIFLLFEPWMSSNFIDAVSLLGIGVEYLGDEMSTILREEFRQLVIACQYFLVQIWCLGVFKGQKSAHHSIEHNTTAPYVWLEANIPFASYHLWRRIAWWSTRSLELLSASSWVHVAQTKVHDLERLIIVQQQVLGLQISVANATLVDILNACNQLLIHPHRRLLV